MASSPIDGQNPHQTPRGPVIGRGREAGASREAPVQGSLGRLAIDALFNGCSDGLP